MHGIKHSCKILLLASRIARIFHYSFLWAPDLVYWAQNQAFSPGRRLLLIMGTQGLVLEDRGQRTDDRGQTTEDR
jgi:hypothetical protein